MILSKDPADKKFFNFSGAKILVLTLVSPQIFLHLNPIFVGTV